MARVRVRVRVAAIPSPSRVAISYSSWTRVESLRLESASLPFVDHMTICWLQIAAGMKADLVIEIYAIAVGVEGESGIGAISHSLEIITEVEYLFLPITANILATVCYIIIDA